MSLAERSWPVDLNMYSLKRSLVGAVGVLATIFLVGAAALYYAASWLLSPQAPEPADGIVVLAGGRFVVSER